MIMNRKLLIKNGHIVDPSQGIDGEGQIWVDASSIRKISVNGMEKGEEPEGSEEDSTVLDAGGCYVLPGLIDMTLRLKDPGYEENETIATGTLAAIRGGFTSVCCMPDTHPPNDNDTITQSIIRKSEIEGFCHVFPIGSITKALEGESLSEMGLMAEAGCVAFSDGGYSIKNSMVMRRSLEYAKGIGVPLIAHPEDPTLAGNGMMNESRHSTMLGLPGIPAEAEIIQIRRDTELVALTHGNLHITPVSTERGVMAVREAKDAGIRITASTCPHYFTLTDAELKNYDTHFKARPPLRSEKDVVAMKEGLRDGTIDCITSDHHPWHPDEKLREFDLAPFGISGVETALALSYTLVAEGVLTMSQLVEKLAGNPAQIYQLDKGTLRPGSDADILIFDPETEWVVSSKTFASKGKNTPFESWRMKGRPAYTIVKGSSTVTQ